MRYRVSGGSIEFDADAGSEDGAVVEVAYASKATTRLEGLVNSSINVQIVFDGFNLAEDDKGVKVTYHKMSLSGLKALRLLCMHLYTPCRKSSFTRSSAGMGVSHITNLLIGDLEPLCPVATVVLDDGEERAINLSPATLKVCYDESDVFAGLDADELDYCVGIYFPSTIASRP